jgi:putative oxidoreductase
MTDEAKLGTSLLLLRLSVFLVMLMWTIDKFVNPQHAATVYQHFYYIGGLGAGIMKTLGALELALLIGFVCGVAKTWTYGLVLLLHAISTLSSFRQYLAPFEQTNLMFFAAWPMLAACVALFLMRHQDRLWAKG